MIRFTIFYLSLFAFNITFAQTNTDLYVDVVDFKTGWVQVDLEQYNVVVETDFAISIQWLEHTIKEGENPGIYSRSNVLKSRQLFSNCKPG